MIIIRARVVNEEGKLVNQHIFGEELKYEDTHEFDFDIQDSLAWKLFLEKYTFENGESLPKHNDNDEQIVYDVYIWGGRSTGKSLFPGYDKSGDKLDVREYGILDD